MFKAFVVNASPIILYSRINRLDLIERLAPRLIIPSKVIDEVKGGIDKVRFSYNAVNWAMRFKYSDIPPYPSVERWNLGPGETQVISMCLQNNYLAVLDDRMARRCIKAHGLFMTGSLGLILRAKKMKLIDRARPLVYELKSQGMYIETEIIEKALLSFGE